MQALEEKIRREGKVLPGDILSVGSFLNQQIDADFMMEMGREIARLFAGESVTKILTVEASGIAMALAAGAALHCRVVFAKKHKSGNVMGEVYQAKVHSYTHGNDATIVVAKPFLTASDRVLMIDDFLASGEALQGMLQLIRQAGAAPVGAAVAIEKGFQGGGDRLRASGLRVESLAIVDRMDPDGIEFRPQPNQM